MQPWKLKEFKHNILFLENNMISDVKKQKDIIF